MLLEQWQQFLGYLPLRHLKEAVGNPEEDGVEERAQHQIRQSCQGQMPYPAAPALRLAAAV